MQGILRHACVDKLELPRCRQTKIVHTSPVEPQVLLSEPWQAILRKKTTTAHVSSDSNLDDHVSAFELHK